MTQTADFSHSYPCELETSNIPSGAIQLKASAQDALVLQSLNFQGFAAYQQQPNLPQLRAQLKSGLDPLSCHYIDSFEHLALHHSAGASCLVQTETEESSLIALECDEGSTSGQSLSPSSAIVLTAEPQVLLVSAVSAPMPAPETEETALVPTFTSVFTAEFPEGSGLDDTSALIAVASGLGAEKSGLVTSVATAAAVPNDAAPLAVRTKCAPQCASASSFEQAPALTFDCYSLGNLPSAVIQQVKSKTILDLGRFTEHLLPIYRTLFASAPVCCLNADALSITSLDSYVAEHQLAVGLLRLDLQGHELETLHGAERCLREHRPVVLCAMHHSPQAFYGLKAFLEQLNLGYRFAVRRSFFGQPSGELMLLAYVA